MNYQVIVVYNEKNGRSYYSSYVVSDDTTLGNIQCTELPPYADLTKAKSCYLDDSASTWVFDEEVYQENLDKIEFEKIAQEEQKNIEEATPTNKELSDMVVELAETISMLSDSISELGVLVSNLETKE